MPNHNVPSGRRGAPGAILTGIRWFQAITLTYPEPLRRPTNWQQIAPRGGT
jgi:hypothetical protein